MSKNNSADKLISHNDMKVVRELAEKHNMSVADFGRSVVRQAERNLSRQIRVTDEEYNMIAEKAKVHGVNMSRWCSLACSDFITSEKKEKFFSDFDADKGCRNKRIAVAIRNQKEETELMNIAIMYSIKISTLIRYCALHYDGNVVMS
jgi:hypothetical protein